MWWLLSRRGLNLVGGVLSSSSKSGIKYVTVTVDVSNVTIVPSESDYTTDSEIAEAVLSGQPVVIKQGFALYFVAGVDFTTTSDIKVKFQYINNLSFSANTKTLTGEIDSIIFHQRGGNEATHQAFSIKSAT